MIALVVALAAATGTVADDLTVLSPETELVAEQAIYASVDGLGCADVEVVDGSDVPVAHACDVIGPGLQGEVLRLLPELGWPLGAVEVRRVGAAGYPLDVVVGSAEVATKAVPIDRTVTEEGVSFRVCHDGEVVAVVRADQPPTEVSGDALVLGPLDTVAWFGVTNGLWPGAVAGGSGTFWFTSFGQDGAPAEWSSDDVELSSAGTVRTDLRFGYDLERGVCPDAGSAWAMGEELDADAPEPGTLPKADDADARGCGSGGAWLWFALFLPFRRRYQTS